MRGTSNCRQAARIAAICAFAGLTAACVDGSGQPAPVYMKGIAGDPEAAPGGVPRAAQQIVVKPGQSLGGVARTYHVSQRAIIDANHLKPPYKLAAGAKLIIPGTAPPMAVAAAPAAAGSIARMPLAPAAAPPQAAPANPAAAAAAPRPSPDVIPLDGPAPPRAAVPPPQAPAAPPRAAAAPPPQAAAAPATLTPPASGPAPAAAREEPVASSPAPAAARYSWPVRGHVLAGYGNAAGGAHNDGINIAAARGAPVTAVDSGVVAYAGNELRGYGNLVMVKHANGFISAYAHCEEVLVKRGDKVARGQVIARVGATGGVSEPQLHFELRRGKKAVDPREFLTPAPSAAVGAAAPRG